ncbi:MAG TPA: GH25 family lysozyme [Flavisolibacter sp.]|jgi:lysozyme
MLKGIDTSHYTSINLARLSSVVKNNKLYFNFIKATEGTTIKDAKFVDLWEMSRKAGLVCGAYHFFRPLSDVAAQADNFISQYKKVTGTGVLPPVIDIEWATVNRVEQWSQLNPAQRVPKIKMYLSAIEDGLQVKPIIYTAPSFWKEFIEPQSTPADDQYFASYLLWVVDLKSTGNVPRPWTGSTAPFVQIHFGENATTNDDFDKTDQNVFTGSVKDLLNKLVPGLALAKGFPFSNITVDVQNALIQKGHLKDAADGLFGNKTEQAVKDFQSANGLFANGIVDAQTWNKLL